MTFKFEILVINTLLTSGVNFPELLYFDAFSYSDTTRKYVHRPLFTISDIL